MDDDGALLRWQGMSFFSGLKTGQSRCKRQTYAQNALGPNQLDQRVSGGALGAALPVGREVA